MSKWASDLVMDAALDYIAACDRMIACSAQPTTYAEAVGTYALADVAMAGGDFTKADGDTSGRKLTVGAKNSVLVDTGGDATHVALVNTAGSSLRYVTTCQTQTLVQGSNVNFPAWDIEIADPT